MEAFKKIFQGDNRNNEGVVPGNGENDLMKDSLGRVTED